MSLFENIEVMRRIEEAYLKEQTEHAISILVYYIAVFRFGVLCRTEYFYAAWGFQFDTFMDRMEFRSIS